MRSATDRRLRAGWAEQVRRARGSQAERLPAPRHEHEAVAEGGCGVIGIAASERVHGHHLLQSLRQMRNRGNGKGGGAAMAGLHPDDFGVTDEVLQTCYALTVAYLQPAARAEVEASSIEPGYRVQAVHEYGLRPPASLETGPPTVVTYFVQAKPSAVAAFAEQSGLTEGSPTQIEEEWVVRNSYELNNRYYASLGEQQAFVLSHGKDMLAFKLVGYGDDVLETYGLSEMRSHVWIGHHRYPTKGRVWHPGGAHPFVGMHEALVHNGDFANYASVCSYLAQQHIYPQFLTDTEVSVQMFDLLHRTYGYPLEYVIEAMAPTTERDFVMLPADRRHTYELLQDLHMHGSPDGPWFFLIAQSAAADKATRTARLIGITDTSMLRPQVFALQRGDNGGPSVGFAASEKQAIDAALASLAAEDSRYWTRPDKLWVARGGSHTDGGAFLFSVHRPHGGPAALVCTDKFGRVVDLQDEAPVYSAVPRSRETDLRHPPAAQHTDLHLSLPRMGFETFIARTDELVNAAERGERAARVTAIEQLTRALDRRTRTPHMRRSSMLSLIDRALNQVFDGIVERPGPGFAGWAGGADMPDPAGDNDCLVIDGTGFSPEGEGSLARAIVRGARAGFRRITVFRCRGHRFLANGLDQSGDGLRLDVYGSAGDYLASGLRGAEVVVHNNGQDQLGQIMREGKLVVHGDVGQTFLYAAKGGQVYVLGSAAGRPLINAVGSPRVVINGTCLDYLAESFMAGDPLNGGGFAIVNGMAFDDRAQLRPLVTPYPGGNLFSLASGGAIFLRDPHGKVGEDQLNGGRFQPLTDAHWGLIQPMLEENERLFGIEVAELLTVSGEQRSPQAVYRAIVPVKEHALLPEEAWVRRANG